MRSRIAIVSALFAAANALTGEIVINDFFSLEGFVDTSYTHQHGEADVSGSSNVQKNDNHFGIEEVEVTFLFNVDPVSALIDIEYEENGEELEVEQAFISYSLDGNLQGSAITAGRYASMLGFEAYERVGRYQYSTAYESGFLGDYISGILSDGIALPLASLNSESFAFLESALLPVGERYSQGVKYIYENDNMFLGISVQEGTLNYENRLDGDNAEDDSAIDDGGYGFEIAYAYTCESGFTYFLGGSYEIGDGIGPAASNGFTFGDTETYVINTYTSYEFGAWLFAFELNYSETEMDDALVSNVDADFESLTGLVMINYAYNNKASITGRISYMDLSADLENTSYGEINALKYTIAHNYALIGNLLFVTELSYLEGDFDSNANPDSDLEELFAAVQLLFVF